jgi:hypothetical protein
MAAPKDETPETDQKDTLILPGGVGPIPDDPIESTRHEEVPPRAMRGPLAFLMQERVPTAEVNSYDRVMTFIRAQGAFIRAQSYFLEVGRNQTDDKDYIQHLTGFATAQAELIRAQQDFLKMFGAM